MAASLKPVEALPSERDFRGPGCGPDCQIIKALLPGVFGRSEILMHDPDTHERYGRALAGDWTSTPNPVLVTGRLTVHLASLDVLVNGELVHLTPTEIGLLNALAHRVGELVSGETLVTKVWPARALHWTKDRHVLRVNMARVRQKLGPAGSLLITIPGLGYRLDLVEAGADVPPRIYRSYRRDKWAMAWDRCRNCQRDDRPHKVRGYCSRRECHRIGKRVGSLEPIGGAS